MQVHDTSNQLCKLSKLSLVPPLIVILLVFLQGGFFNSATCFVGAVASLVAGVIWLLKANKGFDIQPSAFVPLCLVAAYFVSAKATGLVITTVAETGSWAAVAAVSLLAYSLNLNESSQMLCHLAWIGVTTSVLGMLTYVGLIPINIGTVDDRLQFTFQYANATAAWYGASVFLCLHSPDMLLRSYAPIPAAALLLTLSGGGIATFVLVAAVVGAKWAKAGKWGELFFALFRGMFSAIVFAVLHFGQERPAFVIVIVLVVWLCWASKGIEEKLPATVNVKKASLALVVLLGLGFVIAPTLLPSRFAGAISSLVERSYQAHDGLSLWLQSPFLGVGPDRWQYLYPYIQTAPYYSSVTHCSYVQVLDDAGIVGLLALLSSFVVGIRGLLNSHDDGWKLARICAVAMVIIHSLLDFDLRFSAITSLLVILLAHTIREGKERSRSNKKQSISVKSVLAAAACLFVCLPLCVLGTKDAAALSSMVRANDSGDPSSAIALYSSTKHAWNDPSAHAECAQGLHDVGQLQDVVTLYRRCEVPTDKATVYAALSLLELGDRVGGESLLLEKMEQQPYNEALFQNAEVLFSTYGIDSTLEDRYVSVLSQSDTLLAQVSPLLRGDVAD